MSDKLIIAGKEFSSRLILGTGKYPSNQIMQQCIIASGTNMVTTALKRLNTQDSASEDILPYIPEHCMLLPNTSGVRDSKEAVFAAKLAREAFGTNWIKLEIHPDPRYLLPDTYQTIEATKELVDLGFNVMPYIQADPVACKELEEIGATTVMPLASPIGSNKGITNLTMLQIIIEQSNIPVVIDAGLGSPSDACYAMELGADCCMVNTAIAVANNPVQMAECFAKAVECGRKAFLSGLGMQSDFAQNTSPLTLFLEQEQNNVDKL